MSDEEQHMKDEQDDTSELHYLEFASKEEADLFMKNLMKEESEESKARRRLASDMLNKTRVRYGSSLNDRQKKALELLKKAKRPK